MRVLFTTTPATGHFHPLVPTAQALQQAGHEVAFAAAESFRAQVEASGFLVFPAGVGFESLDFDLERAVPPPRLDVPEQLETVLDFFVDRLARPMAQDLGKVCQRWRPDLIISESIEFAGPMVAERRGIPYATIQVGGMGSLGEASQALFARRLDVLRAEQGLPPDPELKALFRYLHLSFMPAEYFGGPLPATTQYLKPEVFDQSGFERLPEWMASLGSRPVVYATLGTVFNKLIRHLSTITEALREEPVDLIVTVGRDMDPARLGPQPSNVHVERYIPQSLLLPRCELAILHGGYNSVMSALYVGLPVLIVPLAADQPMNAQSCERLGVGRRINPDTLTPELLRQQVREMMRDGSYRERARRFQAESQTLPGMAEGVAMLEKLSRERQPLVRA
ncbi:glycosyltransferase [Stigmatella aurantiaca]|uniref:Glycosyltransferase n=1 Tax=Stigmatella aurantiaca (strain DW4/3-1) TaxID=378806 RepID=Q097A6_STIAD|nr:glycosyltransferase [Stigmatella aurantiaca]ADO76054.1 Glycosyltransferase [Stigmatella aurantiaca DW4/3-1]EAU67842.1 glycosyltransferase [Stigmatella aurantiaca DW4/3-1]